MSLKKVTIVEEIDGLQPQFMKLPTRLAYQRNGGPVRYWEMQKGMDTVHIVINKTDSRELLFTRQVRLPVLVSQPQTEGICVECCAGMVDCFYEVAPELRPLRVAAAEVHEEMGYQVHIDDLQPLPTYLSNVGMSGSTCHPFYCEVTDADYIGQKLEPSEDIEVLAIPYEELRYFLQTELNTDATTRQLVQWFILEYGSTW